MHNKIKKLNSRHFKILDLCILGKTTNQIAELLGMKRAQINLIINAPNFQHELAMRRERFEEQQFDEIKNNEDEVANTLREGAIAAAEKLVLGIDSPDDTLAIRSATEILDRTGYPKTQRVDGAAKTVVVINNSDADRLRESLELDRVTESLTSEDGETDG